MKCPSCGCECGDHLENELLRLEAAKLSTAEIQLIVAMVAALREDADSRTQVGVDSDPLIMETLESLEAKVGRL